MGGRYGTFIYGDGTLYGLSGVTDLLWGVEVDWDNDGVFDGTNEALQTIGMNVRRGREFYLNLDSQNQAVGFQRVRPGKCMVTLDNTDGRYDPNNTASILYPNIEPGRDIKITVKNGSTDTKQGVFYGVIDDIRVYDDSSDKRVILMATDRLQYLSDQNVRFATQEDQSIDGLVDDILDRVSWPDGKSLSASANTVPYWSVNQRAYSAIYDLIDAEQGYFFIDADGNATLYSQYQNEPPVLTLSQSELLRDMPVSRPWETVRDKIRVYANTISEVAETTIWLLGTAPLVPALETQTIWATYTYNTIPVSAIDVQTTISSTDYSANSSADGGGSDLSANINITVTDFGETAKIDIQNSGNTDAYITLLRLLGKPLEKQSPTFTEQGSTNNRLMEIDSRWIQTVERSSEVGKWLNLFLPDPQSVPVVSIEGRPDKQFSIDLFDRVTIDAPARNINSRNYTIGSIEHDWLSTNGYAVRTRLGLELSLDPDDYLTQIGVEFDSSSSDDGLNYGIIPAINNLPDRTTTAWINVSSTDGADINRNMIVWGKLNGLYASYIIAYKQIDRAIRIFRQSNSTYIWDTSSDTITENTWTHIAVSHGSDSDTPLIYINGALSGTSLTEMSTTDPITEENAAFKIGNNREFNAATNGTLKDIRVYNRLLPSSDVVALYNGEDITNGQLFHGPAAPTSQLTQYLDNNLSGKTVYETYAGRSGAVSGAPTGREST